MSAVGFLALIMLVMAVNGWVALSQPDSGTTRTAANSAVVVGDQITTTLDVADFKSVDIEGRWQIELTQGGEWQVEVSHSEYLEDDVNVYVRGDRLVLSRRSSGGWWWRRTETRLKAEIVMPELTELELAGANQLDLSGFAGDRLRLEVAGANQVEGHDGRYDNLDLSVAGASEIDLGGIVVTDAKVDLPGASKVTLSMNGGILAGTMAGAGTIGYYGTVAEERVRIAGVGRVRSLD